MPMEKSLTLVFNVEGDQFFFYLHHRAIVRSSEILLLDNCSMERIKKIVYVRKFFANLLVIVKAMKHI